ncbi:MAG TPA: hypothetical protein VEK84_03780, partial [Terriglobales bacterium]|nr:hypothetical protein [Terriglobales bacterium]
QLATIKKKEGRMRTLAELQEAIRQGAVKRLRPKFMTVATAFLGLVPISRRFGIGASFTVHEGAPFVGGDASSST